MSHPGNDDSNSISPGESALPIDTPQPPTEQTPTYQPPTEQPPTYQPSTYPPQPYQPQTYQPQSLQPSTGQTPVYTPPPGPSFLPPPVSAPPPPGQPHQPSYPQTGGYPQVPTPPTYDPALMAQQYSAPPTSGPYGYGMPMMSAIPAPPAARSRVGLVVLSVLTAVFLVSAGVLGTLFVLKNNEASNLSSQVRQLTTDVTAAKSKSDGLQKDLDSAKRDLSDSKQQIDEVTAQKKAITDCFEAVAAYSVAFEQAGNKETPATDALRVEASKKCAEADKYL